MSKLTKMLAFALVIVMAFALVACNGGKKNDVTPEGTLVYTTAAFDQKFSPFFSTTAYDVEVVEMVHGYLLASDRGGAVVEKGIEGETRSYNGTDYLYKGLGDVEVVQNDDGSVDYKLKMRDDITFSDGEKATIDDVIFGIYVMCDPTYDGSSTLYALPIDGMTEYRSGMDSRGNAIFAAGDKGYEENDNYTKEQYDAFWDYYKNESGAALAQEIVDYVVANYVDDYAQDTIGASPEEVRADEALQLKLGMFLWGYDSAWKEGATTKDYWDAIVAAYDGDADKAEATESAGSTRLQLTIKALGSDYETGVVTGETAANIKGIERTGDYTMTVHMTEYDAVAIYDMGFVIAPLHYYGDKAAYDYENNKFGFTKGDLSGVKSKTTEPLGCGPYVFKGYDNATVTFEANENYVLGTPHIKTVLFKEGIDSDYVPGIQSGSYDIAQPSISDTTLTAIKKANGGEDKDIVGDVITTELVDYRGYGYLGINADLVNVDNDPGSDASKALRKGFMTLFSVYRDTVINSYYGDRASVIQYPISNTSWAAPQPADDGYRIAYSVDVDGKDIYTDQMTDEEKYDAALEAAIGYFKAAGFKYDEKAGKFTDVDKTYEIIIPGQGEQDHPAYGVAVEVSSALEKIGIKLQVNDVGTSVWSSALDENTAMMWAAAWQASVDPDMTQVYHSQNAHGKGTNSNHYQVDDKELDGLIEDGRKNADTEVRKSIYKDAMDIILDWGVELPLYQRKDCTCFSTARVDIKTIPQDMTPFWGWKAEIDTMQVK